MKIRGFTVVIIFMIYPLKWQFKLKIKFSNFSEFNLSITPTGDDRYRPIKSKGVYLTWEKRWTVPFNLTFEKPTQQKFKSLIQIHNLNLPTRETWRIHIIFISPLKMVRIIKVFMVLESVHLFSESVHLVQPWTRDSGTADKDNHKQIDLISRVLGVKWCETY